MSLKSLIDNRYSARHFRQDNIEQSKIDYIIDCALTAPSKQSLYPYKLNVLGQGEESTKFKEFLFWEDTWCAPSGERADDNFKNADNKRFNGQYKAPLLLLWTHRTLDSHEHSKTNYWNQYNIDAEESNLIDMTVSASFAMLAAEELGLRTSFCKCHSYEYFDTVLGAHSKVGIGIGIGYADVDEQHQKRMLDPVYKDEKLQGYDTKNLDQSFPTSFHSSRKRKPSIQQLVSYID